jgi:hypothetical protein
MSREPKVAEVHLPWLERERPVHIAVPTAKLHVLNLEPIKARVGEKWPRLSELVHILFEKALRRVQGPYDRFLQVDELSYIATFQDRSQEEAAIACAAVAQEVCDLLFGEQAHAVSLRSVVGMVPESALEPELRVSAISALLEKHGSEQIVTRSKPDVRGPDAQMQGLAGAHRLCGLQQISLRLFPVWDIGRHTSSCLMLHPVGGRTGRDAACVRRLLPQAGEDDVAGLEIALLSAAADYGQRVRAAGKLCAVGTGIGWETLSVAATRSRYLAALKAVAADFSVPLMLKIEQIPAGMPMARLGELVAMLHVHPVRVLVEFAAGVRIPEMPFKLHAAGIGAALPDGCDAKLARSLIDKLNRRAEAQKAFSFLSGIGGDLAGIARERDLRFGAGPGLDGGHSYTGLEAIPDFPLRENGPVHYL